MQIRPKRILFNWVKCACLCVRVRVCVYVCMCCLRLCVYKCVHGNVGHAHSRAPFGLCLSLGQQARGQLQPYRSPPLPVHTSLSPPHTHTHTGEPSPESPKARLEVAPRIYIKHRIAIITMSYIVSKCTQLTNAINAISRYLIASHRTA